MPDKFYLPAPENRCYIGISPNGIVVAASIIRPDRPPEETATLLASWVMSGLAVSLADTEVVRPQLSMDDTMPDVPPFVVAAYTERDGELVYSIEDDGEIDLISLLDDEHGIRVEPSR